MGLFKNSSNRITQMKEEKIDFDFKNLTESFDEDNELDDDKKPVAVFFPKSYDEVEKIIKVMRKGKNVMVHLTEVKTETAIRILDFLSGAVFALGGGVYEMQQNIFMFSPAGVEVNQ